MYTFSELNLLLRGFDAYQVKRIAALAQTTTDPEVAKRHLFELYRFVRPILIVLISFQLIPVSFRSVITTYVAAADLYVLLNPPTPAAPAAEAVASDSTTTDPISTDPSFKAGKDL